MEIAQLKRFRPDPNRIICQLSIIEQFQSVRLSWMLSTSTLPHFAEFKTKRFVLCKSMGTILVVPTDRHQDKRQYQFPVHIKIKHKNWLTIIMPPVRVLCAPFAVARFIFNSFRALFIRPPRRFYFIQWGTAHTRKAIVRVAVSCTAQCVNAALPACSTEAAAIINGLNGHFLPVMTFRRVHGMLITQNEKPANSTGFAGVLVRDARMCVWYMAMRPCCEHYSGWLDVIASTNLADIQNCQNGSQLTGHRLSNLLISIYYGYWKPPPKA